MQGINLLVEHYYLEESETESEVWTTDRCATAEYRGGVFRDLSVWRQGLLAHKGRTPQTDPGKVSRACCNAGSRKSGRERLPQKAALGTREAYATHAPARSLYWQKVVGMDRKWLQGVRVSARGALMSSWWAKSVLRPVSYTHLDVYKRQIYILHKTGKEYNCNTSESKTKVMAFIGDEAVQTKICVDNTCIEQIRHFNYFGREQKA